MKNNANQFHLEFTKPAKYKIVVMGKVSLAVLDSLYGLQPENDGNDISTALIGVIPDQSALSGILNTLYNYHIPVISVNLVSDLKQ